VLFSQKKKRKELNNKTLKEMIINRKKAFHDPFNIFKNKFPPLSKNMMSCEEEERKIMNEISPNRNHYYNTGQI